MPADIARDERLDATARALCARGDGSVIDEHIRVESSLADGQVAALVRNSRDEIAVDAAPLVDHLAASHMGLAESAGGCVAFVAVRRLVQVEALPEPSSKKRGGDRLALRLAPGLVAVGYLLSPDGFVQRLVLDDRRGLIDVPLPQRALGRYVVEVIVDRYDSARDELRGTPEVAVWWPYTRGAPRLPPTPDVLFPDEGHDDRALGHRADALVQRLRNEQLLEPVKLSPVLFDVAQVRAAALAAANRLGHRVPAGNSPVDDLNQRHRDDSRARFVRIAEVQARGSTLADAWTALIESPAHRYELVAPGVTHAGVAVARGADAAGRTVITLVAVLGRRPPLRDFASFEKALLQRTNAAREARGFEPVRVSVHLSDVAGRLARRMADLATVDDGVLGTPIEDVAMEADASIQRVHPFVARLDDPLPLAPVPTLLGIDVTKVGFGMQLHPTDGEFYIAILAGDGSDT